MMYGNRAPESAIIIEMICNERGDVEKCLEILAGNQSSNETKNEVD